MRRRWGQRKVGVRESRRDNRRGRSKNGSEEGEWQQRGGATKGRGNIRGGAIMGRVGESGRGQRKGKKKWIKG